MAGFKYHALDAQGKLHKGVIEVDSPRQARVALRERGLTALEVENLVEQENTKSSQPSARRLRRGMGSAELSLVTRQFATLLGAGLTIEQAMNALIEQTESHAARDILAGVRGDVLAGQTLARAMAAFPNVFNDLYRTLVHAGEQSGQLAHVMMRLADYIEARNALRRKVLYAFIYPLVVMSVALLVTAFLLTYVVPKVVEVFQSTQQQLPILTRVLISISDFLRSTGWYWVGGLVAALWLFRRAMRQEAFRLRFHGYTLRMPLVGRMVRSLNTARVASTLAILVGSRVPLLTSIQAGIGVIDNLPMRRALEDTERRVREGASLSRSLAATKAFPPVMVHLISSGEASGQLDKMLDRVATTQAMEVENRVSVMTALLGPLLIVFMGAVVAFIVIAILLPIVEINQLIR